MCRINDDRADVESESVTRPAKMCGHLPVALRAAAEYLTVHPHRTVAGLVDDLRS
jgi:hypothetical protein